MADPIDTDAMRAWVDAYYPKGTHLTMQYRLALAEVDRLRSENEHLRVALINCDQQRKEYQRRLDAISRNLDGFDLEADCG